MDCEKCNGNGDVVCYKCSTHTANSFNQENNKELCDHCYGTGHVSCYQCFGNGRLD